MSDWDNDWDNNVLAHLVRCADRDPRTGKQCVLIEDHGIRSHRWWRIRSQERPMWKDGFGRIEWSSGQPSRIVASDERGGARMRTFFAHYFRRFTAAGWRVRQGLRQAVAS